MRLYAEAQNRRSGIVALEESANAQSIEFVQAGNRKAGYADGIEGTKADFRKSAEAQFNIK
jgi:hypothetical protein